MIEPRPGNVVTLAPRRIALPVRRSRDVRARVEQTLAETFRARLEPDPARIEVDFPTSVPCRAARHRVAAELDRVERRWRRLYVLHPTESALQLRGE